MTRALALGSAATVAAISLLLVATASAAPKTVVGSVGPGFTISLKLDGKKVTKLKAGVPYRFTVTDRSSGHDFHLTGPGVNKVVTGVGFTGTKSLVLKLRKGTYSFVCDPHSSSMRGSFKVA
ncbi:MAG: plastocyanin/azurin family copper-binding protein [Gaiellaceae bacterium]